MKILIIGGRGFIGSTIAKTLENHDVYTFDRGPGEKNHFTGSILNSKDLENAVAGMDMVINCVGLSPLKQPRQSYKEIHVEGVYHLIGACQKHEVLNLIHLSALGADLNAPTEYLRTKAQAEDLLIPNDLTTVIIRPSLVIGNDSEIMHMALNALRYKCFPKIPALVQPICVEDLAKIVKKQLEAIDTRIVIAAGPQQLTIFELVKKIFQKKNTLCIPIPLFIVKLGMYLLAPLSRSIGIDQATALTLNSITDTPTPGAKSFDQWLETAIF